MTGGRTLTELLEAGLRRRPGATAVTDGTERFDYAELDRRSRVLAGRLVEAGAGPDSVVAVGLPRSAAFVVAVTAVVRSGAAFLPIDPDEAPERAAFLLRDSGAVLHVTPQWLRESGDAPAPERLPAPPDPASLAYVIYTSGSTGAPKGVLVAQDSAAGYVRWAAETLLGSAGPDEGVPLHSPVNVDLGVTSLLVPLVTGRPVHVLGADEPVAEGLPALLAARRYAFVKLTPSHLDLLRDTPDPAVTAATGRLVVGGEALHHAQLAPWRSAAPDTVAVNEYGPTEATVACCAHTFPAGDAGDGPVPIGGPIAGARLHVLDPDLRPVPDGEPGELCVGGPPVTRGYLGRPGLTAGVFVPDPDAADGRRMYRTGDLVRRDADGRLVYQGRVDDQVKLRGHRIEPGEIEAALRALPGVAAAAVTVADRGRDTARLVAHVQRAGPVPAREPDGLRTALAAVLPAHMVPAELVYRDSLPVGASGKIDRSRLAAPEDVALPPEAAPVGDTEAGIAAIVSELLGGRPVDVRAEFFAIGGNSLLAARLVARLGRRYDVDVPVAEWLSAPSVRGFAELVDTYREHGRDAAMELRHTPGFDDLDPDDEITALLQARG